ncbi:3-hydroxyacyl-thioester dehydratase X-like [Haliotis rufescens]|uniref:3-hydroxyacyl-thioester dehydratase X-like n=1 Tax=Haliotis rufescens TaxID=6454 RepID=UPI00201F2F7E|nr:3-hydroxyacyl-thioester dehydratase X-like [Haliotis rufescens]
MAALMCVIGLLVLVLMIFLVKYILFSNEKFEITFEDKPSFQRILLRGIFLIVSRKQGRLYIKTNRARESSARDPPTQVETGGKVSVLNESNIIPGDPWLKLSITNFRLDAASLEAYKKLSCVKTNDAVPICYPETIFMRMSAFLASSPRSFISPLGLIHIRQTITQHRPLDDLLDGGFDIHARALYCVKVERGIEANAEYKVTDRHNLCVWEGIITVLSRSPKQQKSGTSRNAKKTDASKTVDTNLLGECLLHVCQDTGVRYAKATGDWNPHHLFPWTAKLMGFRAPIAHGMWTLARTLDEVFGNDKVKRTYPIHVESTFKRPLFMPGEARIQYGKDSRDMSQMWFKCCEESTGAPHVTGTVKMGK